VDTAQANARYEKNARYAKPASFPGFQTLLSVPDEKAFQAWVKAKKIPFDPSPNADYDMRGFWSALQNNEPAATTAVNPNDKKIHFPDIWKTPYHESFSNESKFANTAAPHWNEKDQLVDPTTGAVVFDERKKYASRIVRPAVSNAPK